MQDIVLVAGPNTLNVALTPIAVPVAAVCPYCGEEFATSELLGVHIIWKHPGAPPTGDIRVTNLTIAYPTITLGQSNIITVTATNYGSVAGTKNIYCSVDDRQMGVMVTLNPGESKQQSFEFIPYEIKTYQVSVDGLIGSFSAVPPVVPEYIYYACYPKVKKFNTEAELNAYLATHMPPAGMVSVTLPARAKIGSTIPIKVKMLMVPLLCIVAYDEEGFPIYDTVEYWTTSFSMAFIWAGQMGIDIPSLFLGAPKTCPYCGAEFTTAKELGVHISREHPGAPPAAPVPVEATIYATLKGWPYIPVPAGWYAIGFIIYTNDEQGFSRDAEWPPGSINSVSGWPFPLPSAEEFLAFEIYDKVEDRLQYVSGIRHLTSKFYSAGAYWFNVDWEVDVKNVGNSPANCLITGLWYRTYKGEVIGAGGTTGTASTVINPGQTITMRGRWDVGTEYGGPGILVINSGAGLLTKQIDLF